MTDDRRPVVRHNRGRSGAQPHRHDLAALARNLICAVAVVLGLQSFLWMQAYRTIGERLERELISCQSAPSP